MCWERGQACNLPFLCPTKIVLGLGLIFFKIHPISRPLLRNVYRPITNLISSRNQEGD